MYMYLYNLKYDKNLDEACRSAIILKGFLPDDEALTYTTAKKLREMMSFTDRSKKRRYCILLTK